MGREEEEEYNFSSREGGVRGRGRGTLLVCSREGECECSNKSK